MRRWLTIALSGLVLSCQGPAAVMAAEPAVAARLRMKECPRVSAPRRGDARRVPAVTGYGSERSARGCQAPY